MVNGYPEFTDVESLRIFIGTWNVNGGKHFRSIAHKHESISDWLLDAASITKEKNPGLFTNKCQVQFSLYDVENMLYMVLGFFILIFIFYFFYRYA